ncbi:magnesium transporter [Caldimicrobium thiodismutans]|jgi:magnesium transporter|uniref:Magnesium transporter n=1 Tax=Caldimicrobium thiodismutans TaxID=1653476 RepID=A0A0U5B1Q8_9BACT|nr:magnesium transporter CorA family protein [Caldimicrobium thiodismutans]BAU24025.1 magnesium transporter [Caldimicrobium thiodismutans]
MIRVYRSERGLLVPAEKIQDETWICVTTPTELELNYLETRLKIFPEFLRYPLDEEERPRLEKEEQQVLMIIRIPVPAGSGLYVKYETIPIGIIVTEENIITICLVDHPIFEDFIAFANKSKTFDLEKPVTFLLNFFFMATNLYLKFLRQIDKAIEEYEEAIFRALSNEEFLRMLTLEKTLTYFNTSLQGNDMVLTKLQSGRYLRLTEEELELLEDVQIENKQAVEMTKVFTSILANTMDAYASIINNNVNVIMKFLASIAIILSIPNTIYSLFGMNIPLPFQQLEPLKESPHAFYVVNAIVIGLCLSLLLLLRKKRYL